MLMVLAVVILAGIIGWYFWRVPKPQSFQIAGPIQKIEGNSIFVNAVFYDARNPSQILDSENRREVEVVVVPETRFVKTTIIMPSREELEKTNGYYEPGKLPQSQGAGTIDDLKSGEAAGVFVASAKNIFGEAKFQAAEIRYILSVYP